MNRLDRLPDELFQKVFSFLKTCGIEPVEYIVSEERVFQTQYFPERKLRIKKWFDRPNGHIVRMETHRVTSYRQFTNQDSQMSMWLWRHRKFVCGLCRTQKEERMTRHRELPSSLQAQYRHLQ